MAFIALHMQDKLGAGLSNSLSPTIAYSPQYAIKWWNEKGMFHPPDIDPIALLEDKIHRRYQYGVPPPQREVVFCWEMLENSSLSVVPLRLNC